MKKDYDFEEEIEDLEEIDEAEDREYDRKSRERARILVTVIPFVLIILILAVMLLTSAVKKSSNKDWKEELQESIMEDADSKLPQEKEEGEEAEETDSQETASPSPEESPSANPSPSPYQEIMESETVNYDKVVFDKDEQLKEMMTYWADNNQKALDDLANLERFIAMSWKLRGTKEFYYYGDTDASGQPNGTGIAVYADNQYYYGGWVNGVRNGNGTWIHYHIHQKPSKTDLYTYHQYTGSWKNDLPDGEGSEHYDYNTELLKENTGYNTNLIGSYRAGLLDGEFYLTNIYSDGNTKEWYATASNGSFIYQNENEDKEGRRPVQVEDRDPENFIWMHPKDNQNLGVACLISKNRQ